MRSMLRSFSEYLRLDDCKDQVNRGVGGRSLDAPLSMIAGDEHRPARTDSGRRARQNRNPFSNTTRDAVIPFIVFRAYPGPATSLIPAFAVSEIITAYLLVGDGVRNAVRLC